MRVLEGRAVLHCWCVSQVAAFGAWFGEQPPHVDCRVLSVLGGGGEHLDAVLCVACAKCFWSCWAGVMFIYWGAGHTLSSASLAVLRFRLPRPFGLRVSTCFWVRAESGARVGDVCSSSL